MYYITRDLRHATVQDAVEVNAKADFRCQNTTRPSFSPIGIIFPHPYLILIPNRWRKPYVNENTIFHIPPLFPPSN